MRLPVGFVDLQEVRDVRRESGGSRQQRGVVCGLQRRVGGMFVEAALDGTEIR